MSNLEIGLLSFPALLILIFIRVPIGLAMFLCGVVGLYLVTGNANMPLNRLKSETYSTFSSYSPRTCRPMSQNAPSAET